MSMKEYCVLKDHYTTIKHVMERVCNFGKRDENIKTDIEKKGCIYTSMAAIRQEYLERALAAAGPFVATHIFNGVCIADPEEVNDLRGIKCQFVEGSCDDITVRIPLKAACNAMVKRSIKDKDKTPHTYESAKDWFELQNWIIGGFVEMPTGVEELRAL